jgi:hypothetical protein
MVRTRAVIVLVGACVACASPPVGGAAPLPPSSPSPASPEHPSAAPGPVDPTEAPPSMTWETEPPPPGVVPADAQSCESNDDCVKVVTTCCDECNGGTAVGVAKQHADSIQKGSCGPAVRCTMRGCFTRVACESGACVLQRGVAK